MAIKIMKPHEAVKNRGIRALVYGAAGSGKTVLCATSDRPTLVISAEGGLLSLVNAPEHIQVVEVKTVEDIEEIVNMLMAGTEFEQICIDSLSEIGEVLLANDKKRASDPRQAYGQTMDQVGNLVRTFRDLPGYHVLMTAKLERIKDEYSGSLMFVPSMPGNKLGQQLPYWFDLVMAMRAEPDPSQDGAIARFLQTARDHQYEAKDRSGRLDPYEPPNLATITSKILNDA